jgi:elongation factor 1-alpha
MDCDVAKYGKERYTECANEAKSMLEKVGWKKDFVDKSVPIIPLSGYLGDNLIKKSEKMGWYSGFDVFVEQTKATVHVHTLLDALNDMVTLPARDLDKPMRMPVSGVYKIKGVGDVITGRVEQGSVKPNTEVVFVPTNTASSACTGKVFTVEMHHKSVPDAKAGDNVGLNVKGLDKQNMPRVGDVMIYKQDQSLKAVKDFTVQVQVLDHPGQLKVGYTPIAFVRTGRAPVKMSKIGWKIGKETGGTKAADPAHIKANEMGEVTFEPQTPFVCDTFKSCEGLGRVAIMEGNGVVMLGKVVNVTFT